MIDWRLLTIKEVLYVDVIEQVKAEGVTNQVEVERRAQRIWHEVCFPLDIYRTDQGSERTQAEFMCEWLQCGYSWETCIAHLETLSLTTSPKRALSLTYIKKTMKRLRENASKTYAPRGGSMRWRLGDDSADDPSSRPGWAWNLLDAMDDNAVTDDTVDDDAVDGDAASHFSDYSSNDDEYLS